MSFQEKHSIVSLVGTILISLGYGVYLWQRYQSGTLDTSNPLSFWASVTLTFIPVQIVFKVLIHIVFSVVNTVATQEQEPAFTDELDHLIELKSTRNFYHVFMVGLLLSIGVLVLNMPPSAMFLGILLAMNVAAIIGDASRFYFYRRGI